MEKKTPNNDHSKFSGQLRVVSKDGQSIGQMWQAPHSNNTSSLDIQAILRGLHNYRIALSHRVDALSLGLLSRIGFKTTGKILALGVIALGLYRSDILAEEGKKEETMAHLGARAVAAKHHLAAPAAMQVANEMAPAATHELQDNSVAGYIERFTALAVAEMDRTGIPASISMAQAIIESRAGSSKLAQRNNNHFGIKCFSKSCPKGHCSNYNDDHHKDFFRMYASPEVSWQEHSQFLLKNRYKSLLKYGRNYRVWAEGLRNFGYATDPNYDKKLVAVIEKYKLYRLDDL